MPRLDSPLNFRAPYTSPIKLEYYWSQVRVPGLLISASQCQPRQPGSRTSGAPTPFFDVPENCERGALLRALEGQVALGLGGLFMLILECEREGELEVPGRGGFWERIAGSCSGCDDDDEEDGSDGMIYNDMHNSIYNNNNNNNNNNGSIKSNIDIIMKNNNDDNGIFRGSKERNKSKRGWIPPSGQKMRAYEIATLVLEIRFAREQFLRWTRDDDNDDNQPMMMTTTTPSRLEALVDEFGRVWGGWEEKWMTTTTTTTTTTKTTTLAKTRRER